MALPTSDNTVNVTRLGSILSTLWGKIKTALGNKSNKTEGVYYVAGTTPYTAYSASSTYTKWTSGDYTSSNSCTYGGYAYYCSTAISTAEAWNSAHWTKIPTPTWTGTVTGVTELYTGMKIAYKVPIYGGTSSTYLNINNLGNVYVRRNDGNTTTHLQGNTIVILTYDGTYWRWADYDANSTYSGMVTAYVNNAADAAKAATSTNFKLTDGITILITFNVANTKNAALTLNVNSTGAKTLYINDTVSSSSNYTIPAGTYFCHYNVPSGASTGNWYLYTNGTFRAIQFKGDLDGDASTASAAKSGSTLETAINGKQDSLGIDSSAGDTTQFLNKKGQWAVPSGTAQVQSDWNQTTTTAVDYIKNKPQNLVQDASYVHTDNNYTTADKNKVASAVQPGDAGLADYYDIEITTSTGGVVDNDTYAAISASISAGRMVYLKLDNNPMYRYTFTYIGNIYFVSPYEEVIISPTAGTGGHAFTLKSLFDDTLSSSSIHPVQNMVVTAALDGKVDKETGKGLISWATYGTTTYAEVTAMLTAGNLPCVNYNGKVYKYLNAPYSGQYLFTTEDLSYVTLLADTGAAQNWWASGTLTPSDLGLVPSSRTVNGKALSSNITLNTSDVGALPGYYIWSGGSKEVYGYKIGESTTITSNSVYCMAMGTIVCTNKYTTDPQNDRDGALVMGFFYIWFYKENGSWKGRMRTFSCNPSLSNADLNLFHYVNGNKLEFFLGFKQNGSSGTLTTKRAVGVGISYSFAQNFNVPASLAEVPQNQAYTGYWTIFKQPYYGQTSEGIGGSVNPVYVNANGNIVACSRKLVNTVVPSGTPYNLYGALSSYEDREIVNVLNTTGATLKVNVSSSSSDDVSISNNRYCSFVKYGSRFYRDS